ncbi:MAG TPA: histidinol-phosphate transaminase [Planctomycetota bacterium]|jgi:histidinol-phosphate/aromatic aminotransferase/cobyric acid decarboxylase-like protein|nr:histidinol-phosphate transaminase [Planctomycetota bacterium]
MAGSTRASGACFHGGAFFEAIGEEFDDLARRTAIVNADVLDAPFPPSPRVLAALRADLDWLVRTSPPVHAEGLRRVIARVRGLPKSSVALGAGSSDLIFRAFTRWLSSKSRVLVVDPSYGEYAHVAEQVVGATVERFELAVRDRFALDLDALSRRLAAPAGRDSAARSDERAFDLVVLVHPNNPTGTVLQPGALERFLDRVPESMIAWIDEAYVDYADSKLTVEVKAAASRNVVVCKSLSKAYALSGMRVAYAVGPASLVADLRHATPPWCVGLPAQVAAVAALESEEWYRDRRAEVHAWRAQLRRDLQRALEGSGVDLFDSCANWLLLRLPELDGEPSRSAASRLVERCRRRGVFLRDAGATSRVLADRFVRIAVRTPPENRRIVAAIVAALEEPGERPARAATQRESRVGGLNS